MVIISRRPTSRTKIVMVAMASCITYQLMSFMQISVANPIIKPTSPIAGPIYSKDAVGGSLYTINATRTSSSSAQTKPRIVIAGPVMNAAVHLPRLHSAIAKLMFNFDVVEMIFYENDSTDNTIDILDSWQNDLWPITRISETNVTGLRTRKLAHARNLLWKHIQKEIKDPVDHVLFMDMDEVNYKLENLEECLNLPTDWSVCCVNQFQIYFDLFALRAKGWLDCDVFLTCPRMGQKKRCGLLRHISAAAAPIPVDSCFGGAALYRYDEHFKGSKLSGLYVGEKNGKGWKRPHEICEHVSFHDSLKKRNPLLKFYIQPKFLNSGPNSTRSEGWPCYQSSLRNNAAAWNASFRNSNLTKYYASFLQ